MRHFWVSFTNVLGKFAVGMVGCHLTGRHVVSKCNLDVLLKPRREVDFGITVNLIFSSLMFVFGQQSEISKVTTQNAS